MKILIIEDDTLIVDNIRLTLKVGWPEAELIWSGLGEEGISMVENERPDIIILDLGLPDINGFEVLKAIRLCSQIPVIILTIREEEIAVVKALEYGADEYIIKPFRQMELVARLKSLVKRRSTSSLESEEQCGPFLFNLPTGSIKYNGKSINLSKTEMLILHHLSKNQGQILSYSSIAKRIWESDYPDSKKAIRVYIRQLRKKIEEDPSNPKLIITEPKIGYMLAKTE